jgi:phosphoribosylformylglycinamidine cyclo-ligase
MAFTYKQSGVNYSLMDPFKNACLKLSGNQTQLIEFPNFYLIDILEAVGSLNRLADLVYQKTGQNYYYQAGWGNAATILNDLAVFGASPLTLKLFVAAGDESWFKDQKKWSALIKGFNDAAKKSKALWNGGETQTLVEMVTKDSFVLAGSATGIIEPKRNLLSEEKLEDGDRIIFIESSGIHTNGITLLRKLFENDLKTLSEALKPSTILYLPLINHLLKEKVEIHSASHITGHGWRKIMRAKGNFSYIVNYVPTPQPIFRKIQQKARMDDQQMYGDYNMGLGFVLFIPEKSTEKVLQVASQLKYRAFEAGLVKSGSKKVTINPLQIEYLGKDLIIR